MNEETVFSKIIRDAKQDAERGTGLAGVIYHDELVTAFRDIKPRAPTHILIVPNILIPTLNDVTHEHEAVLGRMITVAAKIAKDEGIAEDGYRLIMNCNRHACQEIYHIHAHLVGGCHLGAAIKIDEDAKRQVTLSQ
ncbi:HIT domain-containing protein [Candidatus Fukatsuia endosymbiont of Tuberolachnus salignus]|uniref:HIT domain-containing protein n=1 Tax=Candidatus Fukatsuia endosymbiont of Tuberolachnus salignus TaxID=3077957 RepID=UPI00313BA7B4